MRQINVIVDPVKAQGRRVTAQDVSSAVALSNALLPSGEFISKNFDANVYTDAVPKRVKTIGEAPVKMMQDKAVLIKDVATVEDGGTPRTQSVSVDGKEAVYLNVLRIPGGNTLDIVEAARSRFVPIMMTSLATVIGLVPTALGLEKGSEANQPLALSVVGGLTSSTFLSLFLVPVSYTHLPPGRRREHATS